MSQESTCSDSSEISNTMSEGTFQELQSLVGDINCYGITENLPEGRQEGFIPENAQSTSNQTLLLPAMPFPCQSFLSMVPPYWFHTKKNWPGSYGFYLGFEEERQPLPRASPYTYSQKLNKVYAKNRVDIPIRFYYQAPLEICQQMYIRVFVLFSKPEHSRSIVARCPNHESSDGRKHILESSNTNAVYGTDAKEGHHWITLPLTHPQAGQEYVLEFFRFMCLNTCPGGPDRRSFHIVFLLEHEDKLVGRQILDVKICTTPGRDRPKEEEKCSKSAQRRSRTAPRQGQRIPKIKQEQIVCEEPPEPAPVAVKSEEDEIFTIQIKGRKRYEELVRIKEALDIRDLVPSAFVESYRASCPPSGPNWLLEQQQQQNSSPVNIQEPQTSSSDGPSTSGLTQNLEARYCLKRMIPKSSPTVTFTDTRPNSV